MKTILTAIALTISITASASDFDKLSKQVPGAAACIMKSSLNHNVFTINEQMDLQASAFYKIHAGVRSGKFTKDEFMRAGQLHGNCSFVKIYMELAK